MRVGAPLGRELKGPNMALRVVARAADGDAVLFSLTEFDAAFSVRMFLLADLRNRKRLDPREGPLRLVVPGDTNNRFSDRCQPRALASNSRHCKRRSSLQQDVTDRSRRARQAIGSGR